MPHILQLSTKWRVINMDLAGGLKITTLGRKTLHRENKDRRAH